MAGDWRSKDGFGGQADFRDVQLLQHVQDVDHVLVCHFVRAVDNDAHVRIFGLQLRQSAP